MKVPRGPVNRAHKLIIDRQDALWQRLGERLSAEELQARIDQLKRELNIIKGGG